MTKPIVGYAAVALIVLAGVVDGMWTGRWTTDERLERAAVKVNDIPRELPGWTCTDQEMSAEQLAIAEAMSYSARHCLNTKTHNSISFMLLCGRHGPISVHPPTVCFTGAGWRAESEEQVVSITDRSGTVLGKFWQTDFTKSEDGLPTRLRTYWGWSDGTTWEAPDFPRTRFAGSPFLYKLYFTAKIPADKTADEDDTTIESIQGLLPIINKSLAIPSS